MTEDKTECTHCGYEWPYGGDMPEGSMVTCPACTRKTPLEVSEEVDTDTEAEA
jgi:hypothetical protein